MRMPRFAKIQNRLFRQKKHKQSGWLLAFLNSSLGLWILSAIFLSFGSSYFTRRAECLAAARANIELYNSLDEEITGRRLRVIESARNTSNSIDFIKTLRSTAFYVSRTFDGQPLPFLSDQLRLLRTKISNSHQFSQIEKTRRLHFYATIIRTLPSDFPQPGKYVDDLLNDRPLGHNEFVPLYVDRLLTFYQKYWPELTNMIADEEFRGGEYVLAPNCSVGSLLNDTWTDRDAESISLIPKR
jgi:hypothetical protein